jgi:hypothetical protein
MVVVALKQPQPSIRCTLGKPRQALHLAHIIHWPQSVLSRATLPLITGRHLVIAALAAKPEQAEHRTYLLVLPERVA